MGRQGNIQEEKMSSSKEGFLGLSGILKWKHTELMGSLKQ